MKLSFKQQSMNSKSLVEEATSLYADGYTAIGSHKKKGFTNTHHL